jgi:hypothetical protein
MGMLGSALGGLPGMGGGGGKGAGGGAMGGLGGSFMPGGPSLPGMGGGIGGGMGGGGGLGGLLGGLLSKSPLLGKLFNKKGGNLSKTGPGGGDLSGPPIGADGGLNSRAQILMQQQKPQTLAQPAAMQQPLDLSSGGGEMDLSTEPGLAKPRSVSRPRTLSRG